MAELGLGDRVEITHGLSRQSVDVVNEFGRSLWGKRWMPYAAEVSGVVVGVRHLSNGINHSIDYGIEYCPQEFFKAYLISYDMRLNPIYVLPEHIKGLDG